MSLDLNNVENKMNCKNFQGNILHTFYNLKIVLKLKKKNLISRPRVARAGTNKLKCQKNLPTGSHLTQISAGVPNLDETLNLNNFGQNGQN